MFKFLKNLFGPVQVPPPKPESHPLDGATRAALEKATPAPAPAPAPEAYPAPTPAELIQSAPVEKLPIVEIVPELTVQPEEAPVVEKKPRKPRAKKAEVIAAEEAAQWPFPGSPAAMTAAPKTRKPRAKKAQ
jgi:hypothetical protein